jgi:hypothetical protein
MNGRTRAVALRGSGFALAPQGDGSGSLLGQRHHVARAGDGGEILVEIGDQRLQVVGGERAVAGRLIGEAIDRVMYALLHRAPGAPGLLAAEGAHRPGQMIAGVPTVELVALGCGDDGADDEEGGGHGVVPCLVHSSCRPLPHHAIIGC